MKFTDFFNPCRPSFQSETTSSAAKMSRDQMWSHAAPAGISECLAYESHDLTFSSRDVYDAVPVINRLYESPKTLGDRLGQGISGHGLGLHGATKGRHLRCRENATLFVLGACCLDFLPHRQRMADGESPEDVLATAELDDEAVEELVAATSFESIKDLAEEIQALPSLSDLGFEAQEQEAPDETVSDSQAS